MTKWLQNTTLKKIIIIKKKIIKSSWLIFIKIFQRINWCRKHRALYGEILDLKRNAIQGRPSLSKRLYSIQFYTNAPRWSAAFKRLMAWMSFNSN